MSRRPVYRIEWRYVPPPPGHDPLRAVAQALVDYHDRQALAAMNDRIARADAALQETPA